MSKTLYQWQKFDFDETSRLGRLTSKNLELSLVETIQDDAERLTDREKTKSEKRQHQRKLLRKDIKERKEVLDGCWSI